MKRPRDFVGLYRYDYTILHSVHLLLFHYQLQMLESKAPRIKPDIYYLKGAMTATQLGRTLQRSLLEEVKAAGSLV